LSVTGDLNNFKQKWKYSVKDNHDEINNHDSIFNHFLWEKFFGPNPKL